MPGFPRARRGHRPVHRGPCGARARPWRWERPAVRSWSAAAGRLTYAGESPAATPDTVFDLASLTKVLATTTVAMRLVDAGRLDLDAPVADTSACWRGTDRETATVADLLAHSAGLPGHRPYYETRSGRAAVRAGDLRRAARLPAGHRLALQRPRVHPPRFRARRRRRRLAGRPGSRVPLADRLRRQRCGSACPARWAAAAGANQPTPRTGGGTWTTATPRRSAAWPVTPGCSARRPGSARSPGRCSAAFRGPGPRTARRSPATMRRFTSRVGTIGSRALGVGHDARPPRRAARGCRRRPSATPASRERRCGLTRWRASTWCC